jgi:hypothetical protein
MELAAGLGLSKVEVHPADPDLSHVYENAFRSLLSDGGLAAVPIPAAVIDCVRMFEGGMGLNLKRELCPTGVIVFTR